MTHEIDHPLRRAAATLIEAWRWMRTRLHAPRYQALHGLDASTLKDIGIDRSEISSVEAELHAMTMRTRRNLACSCE